MFSLTDMPSTTAVLSTYTTFAASAVLVRTVINEAQNVTNQIVPKLVRDKIMSKLGFLLGDRLSSTMCIVVTNDGFSTNELFEAAEVYLPTRMNSSTKHLRVSKAPREKTLLITFEKGEEIIDTFHGVSLRWKLVSAEAQTKANVDPYGYHSSRVLEKRSFELRFDKRFRDMVLDSYLPFVLERAKAVKEDNKAVMLHSLGVVSGKGPWGSVNLEHPSTFDTLAMDPAAKEELIEDMDRFVRRREFYKRVGKAWKRGYLLYGPPGTGKSSLVAAMANYLKFDVYDLELASVHGNADLRRLIVSTKNRSIVLIEDIDCSVDLENREDGDAGYVRKHTAKQNQLTLSGLLNFIDGLWSSCGDERIIVFTTNHKDRLDPALLRPGRMDMHIHMSYCTFSGFKILASNYLGIKGHPRFEEIERLIAEVKVTPAELAEELMRSEQVDMAMEKMVKFLCMKRDEGAENRDGAEVGEDSKKEEEGVKKERGRCQERGGGCQDSKKEEGVQKVVGRKRKERSEP